ncbi:hypothetical protein WJX72_009583 [[Myrmecia] bisecta]|uniref:Uncharacterized protein n=1 Tax=[Myrmecia] bisecta TaxID=41462 RepID=A0AAW1Q4M5_9CHLO
MDISVLRLDEDATAVELPEGAKAGRRAGRQGAPIAADVYADARGLPTPSAAPAGLTDIQPSTRGGWGDAAGTSPSADGPAGVAANAPTSPLPVATVTTPMAGVQLNPDSGPRLVGVSRRKQEQLAQETDQSTSPAGRNSRKHDDEEELDPIMDIPDLDSYETEDITRQVAAAPHARSSQVQNIQELDSTANVRLPAASDSDDFDLSLLTACLCPSALVEEEMVPWDPDLLLTQLASELHKETEQAMKAANAGSGSLTAGALST